MRIEPVFLFDLDGTLVDSVYQHVLAWKEALDAEGIDLSVWRIHRKIGMSGGLFTNQLIRETGVAIDEARGDRLRKAHAAAYRRMGDTVRPLPGARELLAWLSSAGISWAIATSGRMETASVNLKALGVDPDKSPVVTRDQVKYAKPDPDLFLAAAERLGAPIETAIVVGDSIWDMLAAARCRALGVGLLCGGYGEEELQKATAFRSTKIRRTSCPISTSLAAAGRRPSASAPARDRDHAAGRIARSRRDQPGDRLGDFLRRANPAKRDRRGDPFAGAGVAENGVVMSVSIMPGDTALTRTPSRPTSLARPRVKLSTAPLVAA